jgi:hypothetical protein
MCIQIVRLWNPTEDGTVYKNKDKDIPIAGDIISIPALLGVIGCPPGVWG